jgi:ABC-type transport system involved in multi-copper enzyme maturation permease subunit
MKPPPRTTATAAAAATVKSAVTGAKEGVIVDSGYQPYAGSYTPAAGRWAVIARQMLRSTARQPLVIVMMVLVALPTVVSAVLVYIATRVATLGQASPAGMWTPEHFVMMPWGTTMLAFFLALFAGSGQVADDARAGAFQFYFSRPVTREQYLVGKLIPVIALTMVASLAPALLLSLLRLALAQSAVEALQHLPLVGATLLMGIVEALALAVPAVAASSLSRRSGYVQGLFATVCLLPWLVGRIFVGVTSSPWPAILSIPAHLDNLAHRLYRIPADGPVLPLWVSLACLGLLIGGSFWLLRRRLASVEVVAS